MSGGDWSEIDGLDEAEFRERVSAALVARGSCVLGDPPNPEQVEARSEAALDRWRLRDRLALLVDEGGGGLEQAELANWLGLLEVHARELPVEASRYLVRQLDAARDLGPGAVAHVRRSVRRAWRVAEEAEVAEVAADATEARGDFTADVWVPLLTLARLFGKGVKTLRNWSNMEGAPPFRNARGPALAWLRWGSDNGKTDSRRVREWLGKELDPLQASSLREAWEEIQADIDPSPRVVPFHELAQDLHAAGPNKGFRVRREIRGSERETRGKAGHA